MDPIISYRGTTKIISLQSKYSSLPKSSKQQQLFLLYLQKITSQILQKAQSPSVHHPHSQHSTSIMRASFPLISWDFFRQDFKSGVLINWSIFGWDDPQELPVRIFTFFWNSFFLPTAIWQKTEKKIYIYTAMERIDGATQLPLVLVYHGPYLTHSPFWEWKALRHLLSLGFIWVFPKMGGAPKWMVFFRENPYWKNDDLGVPLFLETPISIIHLQNLPGGRFTPPSPWLWGLCGAEFLLFMTWTPHEPRGKALVKGISGWKLLNFEGPTELYPQWKLRFACIFVWRFSSNKFV